MQYPVVASDGHTCERKAIAEWLEENNTSPLDGNEQLADKKLIPNKNLRSQIQEWLTQNPEYLPHTTATAPSPT
jgi:hypothetical protein